MVADNWQMLESVRAWTVPVSVPVPMSWWRGQGAQSLLLWVAPQSTFSKKKLLSKFLKNIDMGFKVMGKSL